MGAGEIAIKVLAGMCKSKVSYFLSLSGMGDRGFVSDNLGRD